MKYSKTLLEKIAGRSLPDNTTLDALITNHLGEVESIEARGDDSVIDIEITPNRYGDLLSHQGLLREISAFENVPYVSTYGISSSDTPEIERQKGNSIISGSSRIIFAHVTDVKNTESPTWMKEILEACDIQSKTLLVDITNMVMLITGQPVHVYDGSKCSGTFVVDEATEGETCVIMGGKEYLLKAGDLVIRDAVSHTILSLAGIKGGNVALVDESTTHAIFELGVFDEHHIRTTSRRIHLATDASKRFSVHRKATLLDNALGVLLNLLQAETQITHIFVDDTKKGDSEVIPTITVSHQEIERLLGCTIDPSSVVDTLTRLAFQVTQTDTMYSVVAPADRVDCNNPVDIIEEVGRMYGYEKIPEELPRLSFTPNIDKRTLAVTLLRKILSETGFNEIRNHSLTATGSLEVASPVSKEKGFIRDTLLNSFKQSVEQSRLNKDFLETHNVCLYEIGTIFTKEAKEELHIVLFDGTKKQPLLDAFKHNAKEADIYSLLNLVDEQNGYVNYVINFENINPEDFEYQFIGDSVGDAKFKPWFTTPYVSRDVSCFIPQDISPQEVVIWCGMEQLEYLIKKPYLVDEFTKEGKTSVLIRFVFQGENITLTDADVNTEIEKIYTMLREKGCEMR